jgi:hypothetical protein
MAACFQTRVVVGLIRPGINSHNNIITMKTKKSIFCLGVAVSLFFSTYLSAQLPSYVSSVGLIGWYGFEGNANDSSKTNGRMM